jgi:8-oxo-dGTP pyrophosphatase MutT (NUDIX family)
MLIARWLACVDKRTTTDTRNNLANMPKFAASIRRQCGAVPFTIDGAGRVRVALLTSRETRRWVIPKGWPMARRSAMEAARREVREEAGLTGTIINAKPVGHYLYKKRLAPGKLVTCRVAVFLLRVCREFDMWPEREQRVRAWFSPEVAATLVAEKRLAAILRGLTPNAQLLLQRTDGSKAAVEVAARAVVATRDPEEKPDVMDTRGEPPGTVAPKVCFRQWPTSTADAEGTGAAVG